jgi:hypothetical protein
MPTIRLATFDSHGLAAGGSTDERLVLQALAVRATGADLVALQGVPGMAVLEAFRTALVAVVGREYRHALMLAGGGAAPGQPAVLSNLLIVHARSHGTLSFAEIGRLPPAGVLPEEPIFGRDCLELAVERDGRTLPLFICHFVDAPPAPSEPEAVEACRQRRLAEAAALRWIIERRFADPGRAEWVVLGNLADQTSDELGLPVANSGLAPLLARGFAVDLVGLAADAPDERWTRFEPGRSGYLRHDHILVSKALAAPNRESRVRIVRAGLPHRAERHAGPRYPRVGWQEPMASLACPVVADLAFTGQQAP